MNAQQRPAEAHYEAVLASRYTWMMGGQGACIANARALLDAAQVAPFVGKSHATPAALDLGAGGGYHARALADRGYRVTAVDSSDVLLDELHELCAGLNVLSVLDDLLEESAYASGGPYATILCVGDTLTHLSTAESAYRLIDMAARNLAPSGTLILQFREQPTVLLPQASTFTTRSDRDRIMECVLHFEAERVWVTDIVHEWAGQTWQTLKSTYPKLRLSGDALISRAKAAGLIVRGDVPHARQRLLVFAKH